MAQDRFIIDHSLQSDVKNALEIAKFYCKENIPTTDSYSRQGLEILLSKIEDMLGGIGNSFVIGHFE